MARRRREMERREPGLLFDKGREKGKHTDEVYMAAISEALLSPFSRRDLQLDFWHREVSDGCSVLFFECRIGTREDGRVSASGRASH